MKFIISLYRHCSAEGWQHEEDSCKIESEKALAIANSSK